MALASSVLANATLPATSMPGWLRFPLEATGMGGHEPTPTALSSNDVAIKVPRNQVFAAVQVRQSVPFLDIAPKSDIAAFPSGDEDDDSALRQKAAGDVPALREHGSEEGAVAAGGSTDTQLGDRREEATTPVVTPSVAPPAPTAQEPDDEEDASQQPEPAAEEPEPDVEESQPVPDDADEATPQPEESASEPPVEPTPPPAPEPTTPAPTTPPPTTEPPTTPPPTTEPPTTPPPTTPPPTTPPPTTPPPTTPPPTTPPPTTPPPTTPPPSDSELQIVRTTLFNMLNDFRASHGLPRLTYSTHLQTVAQNWANTGLRTYPDSAPAANAHNPNYRSQVGWSRSSELVIRNTGGAHMSLNALLHYMHNWWINSSNHRPWMLDEGYTHAGFGFVRGTTGTPWAVAILGRP